MYVRILKYLRACVADLPDLRAQHFPVEFQNIHGLWPLAVWASCVAS